MILMLTLSFPFTTLFQITSCSIYILIFLLNSLQFINLLYHVHTVFRLFSCKKLFSVPKQIGKQNKCHIIIEWDRNDKEPLTIYYISDSYTLSPHVINSSFSI
ncbi:hypothetical protein DQV47_03570 [Staphylococcus aureus]|uniref:Uncharacterized protein n=1 Tax=Staphylococcus aureus TaxID=1280 RepID=A0A0U1MGL2_STAAU|nr:hypothetical protein DQV47_03570 [Staphylococcus aureus]CRI08060.1 conserved hypothetical protein [Staphylococcus aureus]